MPNLNKQSKEPHVERFRITLADDITHRQIKVAKFSRWSFFVTAISICILLLALAMAILAFTPAKAFVPGYPDADTKKASIQNALKIDSLENVISRWEFYSENLRRIFEGEDPVKIDSIIRSHTPENKIIAEEDIRQRDSLLRQTVNNAEQFSIGSDKKRQLPVEGKHFFAPVKGIVSLDYDQSLHPYIMVSAAKNSLVMAVLDGTVISAEWSDLNEYTIIIQHNDNLLSIYRRNQKLLKKVGDKVTAGSPIALVGGYESVTGNNTLQFELWFEGETINPTSYISF